MEQITVKELATEFDLKNSVVVSELKKIGVWVPSASTPVDTDIANRIRKRLQMMVDAELEEKEKKGEKEKKAVGPKARRSIKELGKPRKRTPKKKAAEEAEKEDQPISPLVITSLKPRKGRKATYRKIAAAKEAELPEKTEVSIDDEPLIEAVEAKAPAESTETVEEVVAEAEAVEEAAAPEAVEVVPPEAEEVVTSEETVAEEAEEAVEVEAVETAETASVVAELAPVAEEVPQTGEAVEVPTVEEAEEVVPAEVTPEPAEVVEAPAPTKKKRALAKKKKKKAAAKVAARARGEKVVEEGPREITFAEKVTVKELAEKIGIRSNEIIRSLMKQGILANMNQVLDETTIEALCEQFEVIPNFVSFEEAAAREESVSDRPEDMKPRAPVVTVMGHVDHGKTSLLDHIRHTRVAESEAGGITQHIGACQVKVNSRRIIFIDTPGHEAFTRMRARGAQATDIVVLVVAADDGVMPQTLEAIDHARAAGVPIVVAVNKIDKPGAQPDRVKQQLSDHGLIAEDWGGDTVIVDVSAIEGTNVDSLLEMILLVGDMQDLVANPNRAASGVILEAKMEKGRGAVASLLVQSGTLRVGDTFIAGTAFGKVRAMFDDKSKSVKKVGPSSAVEVLGLQGIPLAGDAFQVLEDAGKARGMVEFRLEQQREQELKTTSKISLDELYAQMVAGEVKELPIVLKADTQGSVEVLEDTLVKLSGGKVRIDIILKGVGAITESDVLLASASNAIVIGFNVRPEATAKSVAEQEDVELRLYSVIYEVADEIEKAMLGLLEPTIQEKYMGRAEVRETFRIPKVGTVAGSYVQDGLINRNSELRLLRDNVVVYEGKLGSLRRFKEDVSEVKSGYECGISITNFNDVKIGDVIEAFIKEEIAPQLN
jgi:translation initiation factor IF-2